MDPAMQARVLTTPECAVERLCQQFEAGAAA